MDATSRKTTPPRVVPLAKLCPLPSIREWAESRPAVDPVLVARLSEVAK